MPTCVICSSSSEPLFNFDNYSFHACRDPRCRFVFVDPVPTDEELTAVYEGTESKIANSDGWTLWQDYTADKATVVETLKHQRIDWLLDNASTLNSKDAAVLDVGCSTGMFLRVMKDIGYRNLKGFDLSPTASAFVTETHGIECRDSLESFDDETFDFICCYAVLEHTKNPRDYLTLLKSKLKQGGQLLVLVPNYDSYYARLAGKSWVWLIPPVHLQYFSYNNLRRLMSDSGFRVQNAETVYSGTYLYLVAHHISKFLKRDMPSRSRTGSALSASFIKVTELMLSLALAPYAFIARRRHKHCEIRILAAKA